MIGRKRSVAFVQFIGQTLIKLCLLILIKIDELGSEHIFVHSNHPSLENKFRQRAVRAAEVKGHSKLNVLLQMIALPLDGATAGRNVEDITLVLFAIELISKLPVVELKPNAIRLDRAS